MTSEQRYGISPQPKDTCPMINAGLEDLKNMIKNNPRASAIRHADEDELRGMLEDVIWTNDSYYSDVERAFEDARKNATDLRAWGREWKELAKENLDKVDSVQTSWDGIMLWWNELGHDWWTSTWVYKTCWMPRRVEKRIVVI